MVHRLICGQNIHTQEIDDDGDGDGDDDFFKEKKSVGLG